MEAVLDDFSVDRSSGHGRGGGNVRSRHGKLDSVFIGLDGGETLHHQERALGELHGQFAGYPGPVHNRRTRTGLVETDADWLAVTQVLDKLGQRLDVLAA